MKKCAGWTMGMFLLFIGSQMNAQQTASDITIVKPYTITVSYYKTTNLIFPYAIKSVDRGSEDVLVQKAKGVDNILQLKAGKEKFEQTNVSLVTADGKFYSFLLNFDAQPAVLNVSFDKNSFAIVSGKTSEELLSREALQVQQAQHRFLGVRKTNQLLQLALHGIYFSDEALWLKLQLNNNSQIGFRPEYLRFFLRDNRRSKRTALQETEIFPVYTSIDKTIQGSGKAVWAIGFSPFTVPDHQRLVIQTSDRSGGRAIQLKVKSRILLKARKLI